MKNLILAAVLVSSSAFASMTIRYENKDSKAYEASAVCSGSSQDPVKFSSSTTSSVSIQGSTPCKVTLNGTTITFDGDANVIIKDGKMSKK